MKVVDGHLRQRSASVAPKPWEAHFLATDEKTSGKPRQADLYQEQSGEAAHYSLLGPEGKPSTTSIRILLSAASKGVRRYSDRSRV